MLNRKRAFWATTALFSGLLMAGAASAQSSGTDATEGAVELDTVVVTGSRTPVITGIIAQSVPKTRSSIGQEFISTQTSGQTILQSLNLVPGLNFVNSDPYGNSGGNIRLRGFDGNRVSLTFDGMPLNDTGNYAVFTNQQLDAELIERATVNQGTTDVDSPTASATGGTIAFQSARPLSEPGIQVNSSIGENNYGRVFLRADTGAFGPWDTTAYVAASYTKYDKFRGPGELEKTQFNGKIYQDLGGNGNFVSLAGHYNRNRNAAFFNNYTLANFASGVEPLENDIACFRPLGVNGTVQNENTQSTRIQSDGSIAAGNCTSAISNRINPSDTGNIRGQFSYALTDNLRFTFDPSYQYVLATGGTTTSLVSERDDRVDQNTTNNATVTTPAQCAAVAVNATGRDLNGDGDTCDNVHVYAPSVTNTNRYGLSSSLIWDLNDDHRIRAAYSLDYGRHRQTGQGSFMSRLAEPVDPFSTFNAPDFAVTGRDGSIYRFRDRFSIAELQQFAVEYIGDFFNDALTINLGVRAPEFTRELNQYCFSQNGTSTVRCTTETPTATLANGNVTFASTGTTQFIAPYQAELKYDDVLPNVGAVYRFGEGHSVYASYAEGLSIPRTDNLYQPVRNVTDNSIDFSAVQPETTKAYDLGYRFRNARLIAQAAVWYIEFENRIVTSQDNDPASPTFGFFTDRNVGSVKQQGFDGQLGYIFSDSFALNLSASYNDSELQNDLFLGNFTCTSANQVPGSTPACPTPPAAGIVIPQFLPTAGKKLVETPDWTFSARADWDVTENLSVGLQAKYVGERFATDINDEVSDSYVVADLDVRYDLTDTFGIRGAYVQVNVNNLFEEDYLGNISTGNNGLATAVSADPRVPLRNGQARTYSLGSPRTAQITLGMKF